jgi:CHAD domain-containing protein
VPVLVAGLKPSRYSKASRKIRRLTRALGTVRELDVTMHLLDELTQKGTLSRAALEEVRGHVAGERDRRRAVMLKRLDQVSTDKLGRRLASVAEALQKSDDESWRGVLTARLLKRSRRLALAVDAAGPMYASERLHEVRIAAKKLRYGLELAADSGTKSAASLLRPIKRVQDLLGRLHDLQVLQAHVAEVQSGPAAARPGMHAGLEALARSIEEECRHLHGRYLKSAAIIQSMCESVRTNVIPEMEKRRGRQPLKMGLRRRAAVAAAGRR